MESNQVQSFGPRDSRGLIEGVKYVYTDKGRIDWRKMVDTKFLVPNKSKTEETDITKLDDSQLLITLGGLKDLASIRGFSSVEYFPIAASSDYFATVCKINWVANYETNGNPVVYSAQAATHPGNTEDFAVNYLAEIAENRALARCIRSFLKINIVSQEEISSKAKNSSSAQKDLRSVMTALMKMKKVEFDVIKKKLLSEGVQAQDFESVDDVPNHLLFDLTMRLTKLKG